VIQTTRRSALGCGTAGDHRLSFGHRPRATSDDFGRKPTSAAGQFRHEASELATAVAFVAIGIILAQIALTALRINLDAAL
jgi:hypothetical protein